jgi:hypothetical protein
LKGYRHQEERQNQSKMTNVSTPIKLVIAVVIAALVATRFSSFINVSDEWIVVK